MDGNACVLQNLLGLVAKRTAGEESANIPLFRLLTGSFLLNKRLELRRIRIEGGQRFSGCHFDCYRSSVLQSMGDPKTDIGVKRILFETQEAGDDWLLATDDP
jgi:hypothetical protein